MTRGHSQLNQAGGAGMTVRQHVSLLVLALICCALFKGLLLDASAGQTDIAILKSSNIAAYEQAIEGFKATAPSNAVYSEYDGQGDLDVNRKLAKTIRASDVGLVVTVGLKAALAAKLEISDIPVVYMMVLDPQKHSLSNGNMTGTLLEIPIDRQLKIIKSLLPTKRRIGLLYDPTKSQGKVREAEQAGFPTVEIHGFPVKSERDIPLQLRGLLGSNDALWVMPDSTVLTNESLGFILETSLARGVPVIGFSPELTRLGALLSLSVTYTDVGRETGLLAKRVLDGDRRLPMKPIPIDRLKISVNLKTAKFLGIEFPKDVGHLIDETY
ncbi:MAG TPA: ABC transporter substrate-binding protein [Nitrospira sp.]|nr:ABC transporter substrate-binding protein [Nitrospira sp.]